MENNFLIKEISAEDIQVVFDNARAHLGEDDFNNSLNSLIAEKIKTADVRKEDYFDVILGQSVRDRFMKNKEEKKAVASCNFVIKKRSYKHFKDPSLPPDLESAKLFIYAITLKIKDKEPININKSGNPIIFWLFEAQSKSFRSICAYSCGAIKEIFDLKNGNLNVQNVRSFCKSFKEFNKYSDLLSSMYFEANKQNDVMNFYKNWIAYSIEKSKSNEEHDSLSAALSDEVSQKENSSSNKFKVL